MFIIYWHNIKLKDLANVKLFIFLFNMFLIYFFCNNQISFAIKLGNRKVEYSIFYIKDLTTNQQMAFRERHINVTVYFVRFH